MENKSTTPWVSEFWPKLLKLKANSTSENAFSNSRHNKRTRCNGGFDVTPMPLVADRLCNHSPHNQRSLLFPREPILENWPMMGQFDLTSFGLGPCCWRTWDKPIKFNEDSHFASTSTTMSFGILRAWSLKLRCTYLLPTWSPIVTRSLSLLFSIRSSYIWFISSAHHLTLFI